MLLQCNQFGIFSHQQIVQGDFNHLINMNSTPQYLKCYQCKTNPSQFTFLNCNHIYCSDCFLIKVQKNKKHSLVRCACGSITYFNDDNQIIESFKLSSISKQSQKQSQKMCQSKQIRANQNQASCAENLPNLQFSSIYQLERPQIRKNLQERNFCQQALNNRTQQSFPRNNLRQPAQQSNKFLNLQRTGIDSKIQLEQQQDRFNGDFIKQFSTHNICDTPQSYRKVTNSGKNKKIHQKFKEQLQFLRIVFQKQVNEVEYMFKQILQSFADKYNKIEKQLTTLYVENILTKEVCSKLNLSALLKDKYSNTLGNKIKLLKDQLFIAQRTNSKQSIKNTFSIEHIGFRVQKNKRQNQVYNRNLNLQKNQKICSHFQLVKQEQSQCQAQKQHRSRIKNYRFNKFQKQNQPLNANISTKVNHFQTINPRVHTEQINTHVKRPKNSKFYQRPTNISYQSQSQNQFTRNNRTCKLDNQNSLMEDKRRKHIIYYSPPLPYCYKHYQKKSKEARNYINQVQNLCRAKKLKNSKDLFKKFKNDVNNFSYRFQ